MKILSFKVVEHFVQGLFDGVAYQRIQMRMDFCLINFDNLAQVLFQFCRSLLVFHFKPFL